jgi:hypothetical protein
MLNHGDRRRLEAIAQQLQASDPDLALRLSHWPLPARARWLTAAAVLTAAAGFSGLVIGVMMFNPAVAVEWALVMCGGWVWVCRRHRHNARLRAQGTGEPAAP